MAALPAGPWSLAANGDHQHGRDRDVVFVKLTDSALRAVELFVTNQRKLDSSPTIQFLSENEGIISIPNVGAGDSQNTIFRFNLSSNADLEGPQGSFTCLQTGVGKTLRALGSMPTRMRILANDDVYETTKHRMTIDAENLKSKCTRVIKPNQTDIGRKVKVKQQRPPSSRPPAAPTLPQNSYSNTSNAQLMHNNYQQNVGTNGYGSGGGGLYSNHQINGNTHHHNGNGPVQNSLPPVKSAQSAGKPPGNPDIMKRPIRERLIQLLALKAYKRPELFSRINSDGIRERDRTSITTTLQQVSSMKDNCYHLHRNLWNEVNEDWPFFSEEEKQTLKRRKPQNLTPPLSSDSGHSPSPPPGKRIAPSNPPFNSTSGQPAPKKQRISHFKKQDTIRESGEASPAALSNGYHSSTSTSGASSGERKNYSDEETPSIQTNLTPNKKENNYSLSFGTAKNFLDVSNKQNGYQTSPSMEHVSSEKGICSPVSLGKRSPLPMNGGQPPQRRDKKSPDSTTQPTHSPAPAPATPPDTLEVPDYETQYTKITSLDQRRRYKTDFASEYEEYRNLHSRIESVALQFTRLEERLRGETPGGPNYREIKRQIVEDYQRMQRGHQRDVEKFHYLHSKLAHIKRLVGEYDRIQTAAY